MAEESPNNEHQCCENPMPAEIPDRRFKLPGNSERATHTECMNCSTLLD